MRLEHEVKQVKEAHAKMSIPEDDKAKIKSLIQDNIRMKLKLKEIMDELKAM